MKINNFKNTPSFNGIYNNKIVLNSLEKISQHSGSFVAGASLLSATLLRPLAINSVKDVKKENKEILTAESISSALTKFLMAEAIALPIESAIKTIDKNPEKYLNKNALKELSQKDYKFLTQTIKLGSSFVSAIPKSILGVSLIPVVADFLFNKKQEPKKLEDKKETLSFKGNLKEKTANSIANIINSQNVQKFAKKYSKNDKNVAKNMSILTDILLCATSVIGVRKSQKIEEERKKPLVSNKIISTMVSIFVGDKIDKIIQKSGQKHLDEFIKVNKNNPKLSKYIEGINVLRPTLVFALLYYGLIPIFTTIMSEKINSTFEGKEAK